MKQVHRKRTVGSAFTGGFTIINGTPPGPSDPVIVEFQPVTDFSCATCLRTAWRTTRHCRARNW
jgi:hypothetical protein